MCVLNQICAFAVLVASIQAACYKAGLIAIISNVVDYSSKHAHTGCLYVLMSSLL